MTKEAATVEETPMTDEALMEIMRLQALNAEASMVEGEMHQANFISRPQSLGEQSPRPSIVSLG
jgi:hypothetical protein